VLFDLPKDYPPRVDPKYNVPPKMMIKPPPDPPGPGPHHGAPPVIQEEIAERSQTSGAGWLVGLWLLAGAAIMALGCAAERYVRRKRMGRESHTEASQ
jgi:hypothetical protein